MPAQHRGRREDGSRTVIPSETLAPGNVGDVARGLRATRRNTKRAQRVWRLETRHYQKLPDSGVVVSGGNAGMRECGNAEMRNGLGKSCSRGRFALTHSP